MRLFRNSPRFFTDYTVISHRSITDPFLDSTFPDFHSFPSQAACNHLQQFCPSLHLNRSVSHSDLSEESPTIPDTPMNNLARINTAFHDCCLPLLLSTILAWFSVIFPLVFQTRNRISTYLVLMISLCSSIPLLPTQNAVYMSSLNKPIFLRGSLLHLLPSQNLFGF